MPSYAYKAVDHASKKITGILVSENEIKVEQSLSDIGLYLVDLKIVSADRTHSRVKVSRREMVDLFNGLSAMLEAGIDVSQCLSILRDETPKPELRNVLADLKLNVESGIALDDAMDRHPSVFEPDVRNLIRAGSHSGKLVEACKDVADHLEWLDHLVHDIKQATVYPTVIIIAVFGLILLLFSFVVPQFSVIFDSLDLELPGITKAVVAMGNFTVRFWWIFILAVAAIFAVLKYLPKWHPEFGLYMDKTKLRLPLFGSLLLLLSQSRFAHNLSLMLKAGVPIVEALNLLSGVVGNRAVSHAVIDARHAVTEGRTMSDGLTPHRDIFTPIIMRMIVVGEESGKLDTCLEMISNRLDTELPRRIKRLFSVLEPMIITTLIGIVGLVAAAIFLPLFSLMGGVMG